MSKVLIVYGSETGNTEKAAQTIRDVLQQEGIEVCIRDAKDVNAASLGQGFDLTVLGSSSRGDIDTISFPQSFAPLYDRLNQAQIREKDLAIFGCGDSSRPYFCGAVELLKEKIGDLRGRLIHTPLRIDGDPDKSRSEILAWSRVVVRSCCRQGATK